MSPPGADRKGPSDETLLALANRFALDGNPLSAAPFGGGLINDSYRLECADRGFLLQRINLRVFTEPALVMDNIQRVTSHLVPKIQRRYPKDWKRRVLQLIPTKQGNPVHIDKAGHWWRMFRFVENSVAYATTPDISAAYAAAEAFGGFTRDLTDLPGPPLHETIPAFHDTPARLEALLRTWDADPFDRAQKSGDALEQILQHRRLVPLLSGAHLPARTVHNDTKIDNVLFDAGGLRACCVVDLDTVMPGMALHDFGDLIRSAAAVQDNGRLRLDMQLYDALLNGWLSGMGETLSGEEKNLLAISPQVITLELAIRFLTDHLEGDRYFKVQRAGQNLQRTQGQLSLLTSMQAQEKEMQKRCCDAAGS